MRPPLSLSLMSAWSLLVLALLLSSGARAGEGHDHGEAAATPSGPASPRFVVVSDLFELVGVLDGHHLRVYLDAAATNAPVAAADLQLELGGKVVALKAVAAGEFEAELPEALPAGVHPVTATVSAAGESDLLAGELDLHAPAAAAETSVAAWPAAGPWIVSGVALAVVIVVTALRRRARRQRQAAALVGGVA